MVHRYLVARLSDTNPRHVLYLRADRYGWTRKARLAMRYTQRGWAERAASKYDAEVIPIDPRGRETSE